MSQYVPKPDEEGINSKIAPTHLKDLSILLAGFFALIMSFYFVFTTITDWALTQVSLETELKYLAKVLPKSEEESTPTELKNLLARVQPHVTFPLDVGVMCAKEPNAFALPGGRILMTTGLLENMKSENGLVFVLGHEIGHILNRDHLKGVGRQIVFALGGAIFGFNDIGGLASLSRLIEQTYSRNQEVAADDSGLGFLRKHYGHTWGAEELFAVLQKQESTFDRSLSRFASTHPPSADRFERMKATQVGPPQQLKIPATPYGEWLSELHCHE